MMLIKVSDPETQQHFFYSKVYNLVIKNSEVAAKHRNLSTYILIM